MQRYRSTRSLKDGSSVSVSALAFIIRLPIEGSAAQCGINPQCISLHSLPPLWRTMTGMLGEVSGATLNRGVYFGRSRVKVPANPYVTELVAVNRPHMSPVIAGLAAVHQAPPLSTKNPQGYIAGSRLFVARSAICF